MLAEIGIIVGMYVMTRMLCMDRNKDGTYRPIARLFAAVTFLVALLVVIDLFVRALLAPAPASGL